MRRSDKRFSKRRRKRLSDEEWAKLEREVLKYSVPSPLGRCDGIRAIGASKQMSRGVSHRFRTKR